MVAAPVPMALIPSREGLMPVTEARQIQTEEAVLIQQVLVAMVQDRVQAALVQEQEQQDQEVEQQVLVAMVQDRVQAALVQEQEQWAMTIALNKKQKLKQRTEKKQRSKQRMAKRK